MIDGFHIPFYYLLLAVYFLVTFYNYVSAIATLSFELMNLHLLRLYIL
jgi:hypothetical protein